MLHGTTSLVTGAGRGIGRAIARRLAAEGSRVAVHYGTNADAAAATVDEIRGAGGDAFAIGAELGVPGDVERLWAAFDEALGPGATLDVLVNNAAIGSSEPLATTTPEAFDRVFAVNVKAPFFLVQRGLDRIRDDGRIINVSSGVTRIALPETLAYSMTKGALNTFSFTLAHELGARGITVNAVAPGITDTDTNAAWLHGEARAHAASYSAFDRVGEPDDIADVVAFLASPAARWITGQVIDATGGSHLGAAGLR
ncbi:SDR family oxidoreductase [Cryptosporangium japonicum]